MSKNAKSIKRHWYLLAYSCPAPGTYTPTSMFVWAKGRYLTLPEIKAAREQRQIPDGSVLTTISYVGFQDQYTFTGESPVVPPTVMSDTYKRAMQTAMNAPNPHDFPNPYTTDDPYNYREWENGFALGLTLKIQEQ